MYEKAKRDSEISFRNCLVADDTHYVNTLRSNVKFIDVTHVACDYRDCVASTIDRTWHADVIAHGIDLSTGRMRTFWFDVKDIEDANISSGNYSLGKDCVDYCLTVDDENWLVFRLADGKSKHLDKYIAVQALELCMKLPDFAGRDWCLVSLDAIRSCSNMFEVEGDF